MYMRAELIDAHDTYYALNRRHLSARNIDSPTYISEPDDLYAAWQSSDLFISQTCGMPYRLTLHGKVQLIGTPDFKLEGCKPGYYRSAMVVRREDAQQPLTDFQHRVFTYNADDSHSGYATAYELAQKHGFWFEQRVRSGGHRESALAIAEGCADIAAIDAMTWRLLQTYETFTDNLTVIEWTEPAPGLPYITSLAHDAAAMFEAISSAIDELPAEAREILHINSLVKISAERYLAVCNPPV